VNGEEDEESNDAEVSAKKPRTEVCFLGDLSRLKKFTEPFK
jgi:hypothetical protein